MTWPVIYPGVPVDQVVREAGIVPRTSRFLTLALSHPAGVAVGIIGEQSYREDR